MSTIANLVAKLTMDNSNFAQQAARSAQQMAELGAKAVQCNAGIRVMNSGWTASTQVLDAVDQKAGGAVKTLLKLGSAAAMIATAVKASFNVDKAKASLANAKGDEVGPGNTAVAYDRVSGAVTRAYEAFGQAFSKSAGLSNLLDQLANIVSHLNPLFQTLGSILGSVVAFMSSSTPAAIALLLSFKALAIACGALVVVIGILIKRQLVIWLTGASPLTWLLAAAQWALNAAWSAGAIALGLIMSIGLPLWAALGIVIAVVAATVYGLVKAWQWLTSSGADSTAETAKQTEKLAKSIEDAGDAAAKLEQDAENANLAAKYGESGNKAEELGRLLAIAGRSTEEIAERVATLDAQWADTNAIKKRKKALEDLAKIHKDYLQAGMSANAKAVAALAEGGLDSGQQTQALHELEKTESISKQLERQKDIAQQLADIEKAARQAGMTDSHKRIDDMQQLVKLAGDREYRERMIAQVSDRVGEAEKKTALAKDLLAINKEIADLEFEAATASLTAGQKRVAMAERLGAQGEQLAKAKQAGAALDKANETKRLADLAKHLTDATATPLEKYKKALADIKALTESDNPISAAVAQNALGAANKDFFDSLKGDSFKLESPTAILKGSAEAELLNNRQTSPIEKLTQIQRDQLAEQQKLSVLTQAQLDQLKINEPKQALVADLN